MNDYDGYGESKIEDELILEAYEDTQQTFHDPIKKHGMLSRNNNDIIKNFLGKGPLSIEAYSTEMYYGKLLAWTVKCITTSPG
jgi:hypothetical protein